MISQNKKKEKSMALSNLFGWTKKTEAASAADKGTACGTACRAGDKEAEKPAEKSTACGSACGAGDKPEDKPEEKQKVKPAACGTACGAGDK